MGPEDAGEGPAPGSAAADVVDRGLVAEAVELQVVQNRVHARRLELMHVFYERRVAEVAARDAGLPGPWDGQPGFFWLTPLQATKAEFGPLLGISEMFVQLDLDLVGDLKRWLPGVWERCLAGWVDISRAVALREQLVHLAGDAERARYGELVEEWLARHDPRPDDPDAGGDAGLLRVPRSSVQRAAARLRRRLPQRSRDESFAAAYARRQVSMRPVGEGMAALSTSVALHEAVAADHRLTLIARKRREVAGESRTLAQLRADTLVDLLLGRLSVATSDAEPTLGLTDARPADGPAGAAGFDWSRVGAFARPVVNVTVSLTTLIGLDDEPAQLNGVLVPGELARVIGADPDAVWHRMLVDPGGGFVELSTDAYAPSEPVWRWVVARDVTCVFPGCARAAVLVELDHRVPWPVGRTWTWNLQPLCRRHHKVKHSHGYRVRRHDDGSYTWTSRFGSVLHTPAPEYPAGVWADLARQLSGRPGPEDLEPTPLEYDDPRADPVIDDAYHEWFTTEVLPTL